MFVPHIDKTGGISVREVLRRDFASANWTIDEDPRSSIIPERKNLEYYARLGIHNSYMDDLFDDSWFKFLVIREPLDRFISTYNYYKFQLWQQAGEGTFLDITLEQYCDLVTLKNKGLQAIAAEHISPGILEDLPRRYYYNYIDNVLSKWPWSMILLPRGYISTVCALNAQCTQDNFFTNEKVIQMFDVIIDKNRLSEIPKIMLDNTGVDVTMDVRVNTKEDNYKLIAGSHAVMLPSDVTVAQLCRIQKIPDFITEMKLWSLYKRSHHANN